jgi:ribose/xylose/arabinose/galactoside ABC-type transport system permease subunit
MPVGGVDALRAHAAAAVRGRALPDWVPYAVVFGAVIIGIGVAVAITPSFLTWANWLAILRTTAIVGIVAVGMTPMTLSGNLVSLGAHQSAMATAIAFIALVGDGRNQVIAIVAVAALMIAIGVAQGLIVAAGLNPVITTLAAGAVILGVVSSWTGGKVVTVAGHPTSWGDSEPLGLPLEVWVFFLFTLVVTVVMSKTVIGRQTVLTGANRATASLSGISFRKVTVFAFVVFSIAAAIAGVLYGAGFEEANTKSLASLTFEVVAGVLVGGTAIQGGKGSPLLSAWGALLIAVIGNIMLLNDFTTGGRLATQGAVVVGVVVILQFLRRGVARR